MMVNVFYDFNSLKFVELFIYFFFFSAQGYSALCLFHGLLEKKLYAATVRQCSMYAH